MTEDKPEDGSHLRTLARSHRQARSHRVTIELLATCQASIVIGYYPVRVINVFYRLLSCDGH